jgi:hypothetical protein
MSELEELLDALDAIYARRDDSFVVVKVEGEGGLYVEIGAPEGETGLEAEIVGVAGPEPTNQLSLVQQAELRERGWERVGPALWCRAWPRTPTRADRQRVAYETLRTLGEVYGTTGAVSVDEVGLAGGAAPTTPPTPEAPRGARIAVLIVAALLALLGAALALFVGAAA